MRSHEPTMDVHAGHVPDEASRPLADLAVAVLGLLILALCWGAVWYLVTRPPSGESQGLGQSVMQVLEGAVQHLVHRGVVPMP